MERKAKDELKMPSRLGARVGKNVDNAIMNAMNLGIEYRTKSMEEFEKELLAEKDIARILEPEKKEDTGKLPLWVKITLGAAGSMILVFVILIVTGVINFGSPEADTYTMAEGMTHVPNVVNQTIEQAQVLAEENRVSIQIVDKQNSDVVPRDLVMSQTPENGREVSDGTVMELVISAGKEQVYVPDVVGMMQEEAEAILEENGLTYEQTETDSNLIAGTVVNQSMEADSQTDKETSIVLTVSNGYIPDMDESMEAEIPDLTGLTFQKAQELLYDNKLLMARTEAEYSSTVSKGCIISQNIEAGATGHQGDVIEVTVSLGNKIIRVPDVQYKDEEEAIATLEDSGLVVSVHYEASDIVAVGKVISQDLEAGTEADWNSEIMITVSGEEKVITNTPTPIPTDPPVPTETPVPTSEVITTPIVNDEDKVPEETRRDAYYNADGTINFYVGVTYDDMGNRIRQTSYHGDGSIWYSDDYDASGNCVKTTTYNRDGTIDFYQIHEYSNGRRIKCTVYYANDTIREIITYNEDGSILEVK